MHHIADAPARSHRRFVELDFVRGRAIIAVMGIHFHTVDTGSRLRCSNFH